LSGLVGVTASCGVIDYWAALIIGIVSGWVYIASDALLIKIKIDDAVSAIPVHLANGLWGIFASGLFASPKHLLTAYGKNTHGGLFYVGVGNSLMPAQIIGTVFIIAWTFITMGPFFIGLDYMGWFRVNELEELVGLDATYSGNAVEDDASENEDLRLAAYRQRFEERKQMRENKPVKTMTVDALLNESFFGPAAGMGPPTSAPDDLLLTSSDPMDSKPEQANARSDKLINESCDL
jgi:Ammonium Transporter Family